MRWIILALLGSCIGLVPAAVTADRQGSCGAPNDLHDGWSVAVPETEGLDPTLICGIGPRLKALKEAKAHGVVIIRHGQLVYERYFTGKDWALSMPLGDVNFDAGTKHDIRSISKSVTSLLVGMALERGLLTDLDTPVFSFFPEYDDLRTPAWGRRAFDNVRRSISSSASACLSDSCNSRNVASRSTREKRPPSQTTSPATITRSTPTLFAR